MESKRMLREIIEVITKKEQRANHLSRQTGHSWELQQLIVLLELMEQDANDNIKTPYQ